MAFSTPNDEALLVPFTPEPLEQLLRTVIATKSYTPSQIFSMIHPCKLVLRSADHKSYLFFFLLRVASHVIRLARATSDNLTGGEQMYFVYSH